MGMYTIETRELEDLRRKHSVACGLVAEQAAVIRSQASTMNQRNLKLLAENTHLRAELERAMRDMNRLGMHSATINGCVVCNLIRTYGFDPKALRGCS